MARPKKTADDFGKMGLARLRRQWHLLTLVPKFGRTVSTAALADRLHETHDAKLDKKSFLRKVQHDLEQLSTVIPELQVDKLSGVHWNKSGPPIGLGLNPDEVLAFGVLKKLGVDWMPAVMQKALEPYFKMAMSEAAQQVEERLGFTVRKSESKAKKWLDRVERLPDWVGFQKPRIIPEVEKVIHEALLYETSVEVDNGKGKKTLHPQAIVQRGVRTYLLALNSEGSRLQSYLLSRLISARPITSSAFRLEEQEKIQQHLNKGIAFPEMPVDIYGKETTLKLWGDVGTTQWLKETPLSKDQTIKPLAKSFAKNNPWSEIQATVLIQEELIWWLRSMGPNIQVREPKFIKERIRQDLEASLSAYQ